jgi:hypothetical protein
VLQPVLDVERGINDGIVVEKKALDFCTYLRACSQQSFCVFAIFMRYTIAISKVKVEVVEIFDVREADYPDIGKNSPTNGDRDLKKRISMITGSTKDFAYPRLNHC